MNRALAVLFLLEIPTIAAAAERPNVILILIYDLGRNDVACYGSTFHKTPNIDRLAREGVKFTDAYAAAPVCSPTRAAIMTGKHPARLNLTDWLPGRPNRPDQRLLQPTIRQQLPLEEITIAEEAETCGIRHRPHRQMAPAPPSAAHLACG